MKKVLITIGSVLALGFIGLAQQEQQYTQYMVNGFIINPARTGTEGFIDAKLGYRNQWLGMRITDPGQKDQIGAINPRTGYFSIHSNISHHGTGAGRGRKVFSGHPAHHGLGAYVYDDKTGPIGRMGFYGSYAYNIPVNKYLRVSLGAMVGGKQFRVNGADWFAYHGVQADDLLRDNALTKLVLDGSFGAFMYSEYYYLGISTFQIFQSKINQDGLGNLLQTANSKLRRHYFITGGMNLPVNSTVSIVPSFALKMIAPAPASIDANIMYKYGDLYFFGISTRLGRTNLDSFSGIVGTTINKRFDVSYSYDLNLSGLALYNTGSHEIVIGYRFKHPYHVDCPGRKFH